jgi:hypothetical protein
LFAETVLQLRSENRHVQVRLFAPQWEKDKSAWGCRFEVDTPMSVQQNVYGESGLQALSLALKILASTLYGSEVYREGKLGAFGEFGGYLGIPAPSESLSRAPYPF